MTLKWTSGAAIGLALALAHPAAAADAIKVKLVDDAIQVEQGSAKAGKVSFEVKNDSLTESHEMVVIAKPASDIPYDAKKKRVVEGKIKSFGEVSGIKPGATKTFALNLKPGDYMLICNMPGHYADGMKTNFTVTQ
jgi:uncharacterized cupredoxin-like copper-binding protein